MENDDLNDIRVVVSLNEIEFLNLEDVVSQQERTFLLSCLKSSPGDLCSSSWPGLIAPPISDTRLPGAPGRPWQTPRREQQSVDLDFGSATEVFHSLQSGVSLDHDEAGGVGGGPGVGGQPQQSHISLPPYMAGQSFRNISITWERIQITQLPIQFAAVRTGSIENLLFKFKSRSSLSSLNQWRWCKIWKMNPFIRLKFCYVEYKLLQVYPCQAPVTRVEPSTFISTTSLQT